MKAYFAPCGIGLGHVGRCIPIAKRLLDQGTEIMFSTYREGLAYVEREHLPLVKAPPIGFQVRPDGSIDFKKTAINPGPFISTYTLLRQVNSEMETIGKFGPDVVVSDSRASSLLAARLLRIPRICILNQFQPRIPRKRRLLRAARLADAIALTMIGKIWTSVKAVLIPDFPEPYTISLGNLTIPKQYRKNVKLIGPIVPTKAVDLPSKQELRRKLNLPQDKPVIFAAVSGPTSEKAFLTGILRKTLLEFPEEYEIVMSLGYPSADNKPIRHSNMTIFKWIPNRFEYLKACDLVIGRAGHGTITQSMCYGKTTILIPTPGHTEQLNNAKQAESIGAAKILLQKRLSRQRLLTTVQEALKQEMLEKAVVIQKEALKHDGLTNAVNEVMDVLRA